MHFYPRYRRGLAWFAKLEEPIHCVSIVAFRASPHSQGYTVFVCNLGSHVVVKFAAFVAETQQETDLYKATVVRMKEKPRCFEKRAFR